MYSLFLYNLHYSFRLIKIIANYCTYFSSVLYFRLINMSLWRCIPVWWGTLCAIGWISVSSWHPSFPAELPPPCLNRWEPQRARQHPSAANILWILKRYTRLPVWYQVLILSFHRKEYCNIIADFLVPTLIVSNFLNKIQTGRIFYALCSSFTRPPTPSQYSHALSLCSPRIYLQTSHDHCQVPVTGTLLCMWVIVFPPEWWEDPFSSGQGVSHTGVLSHTHILFLHFVWRQQSVEGAANTVKLEQNK